MSRPAKTTHEAALDLLDKRAMSSSKLRAALASKGHEPEAIEDAIEALSRVGLLDDEAMARDIAERLLERETGWKAWLVAKITSREIEEEIALRVVDEVLQEHEEDALLQRAIRERQRVLPTSLTVKARYRRLAAYLVRRGFSEGRVTEALQQALETEDADLECEPTPDGWL